MHCTVHTSTLYTCSLERAFKTPMLCDVAKVHTGYGLMPKITHTTHDEHWGVPGSSKRVYAARSLFHKGGYTSDDHVLERLENSGWVIAVDNFQAWMLGFNRFVGSWQTTQINEQTVRIDYTYELHFTTPFFYPLNWLFARLFWLRYMKHVLENVRQLAYNNEPYRYP